MPRPRSRSCSTPAPATPPKRRSWLRRRSATRWPPFSVFFSLVRPPPTSPLFPYTTLFRSLDRGVLLGTTDIAGDNAGALPDEHLDRRLRHARTGPGDHRHLAVQ